MAEVWYTNIEKSFYIFGVKKVNDIKLINAEVQDVNERNSTFNVLLTFHNGHQAKIYCREEVDGLINAYNLDIAGGKCPCCGKPACSSLYVKREELLKEAQMLTKFPSGMGKVRA